MDSKNVVVGKEVLTNPIKIDPSKNGTKVDGKDLIISGEGGNKY